jgi:hypothetical protein
MVKKVTLVIKVMKDRKFYTVVVRQILQTVSMVIHTSMKLMVMLTQRSVVFGYLN